MNILQVLPELNAGGVERTTLEIVEALTQAGHEAHIISAGGRMVKDVKALNGEHSTYHIGSKNILSGPRRIRFLRSYIQEHKIDIIHARSRAPAWPAFYAARAERRPFVTSYQGHYKAANSLKRYYNSVMTRGEIVIANSEFTRQRIIAEHKTAPEKIITVPRGVDISVFDPDRFPQDETERLRADWSIKPKQKLLLLPGRLTRWKGQLVALKALADLPEDYVLICLGDAQGRTAYLDEIEQTARNLNLSKRLRIFPHTEEIALAMLSADIVLSCSTEPEAFGRIAIEAQAMGRPVIATAHGGALATVIEKQTGLLIPPNDPKLLAHAIMDAGKWKSYDPRAARDRIVTHFSKAALQRANLAIYRQLIDLNA